MIFFELKETSKKKGRWATKLKRFLHRILLLDDAHFATGTKVEKPAITAAFCESSRKPFLASTVSADFPGSSVYYHQLVGAVMVSRYHSQATFFLIFYTVLGGMY